jgi:translation initiation factor IF-1
LTNQQQQKTLADGQVIEALPDTKFKVKLQDGQEILAYLSGKMRINYIKVMIGDRVSMELSPDGTRGRIVRRL